MIPEAPETNTVDLLKEDIELPEVERLAEGADVNEINSYSYPRLDDLFKKALKAQIVPDVSSQSAAADTGKKAAGKKDPKAKGGAADAGEDTKPESIYVREMKEAIKTEKSILRFRLTQIRNWAHMRLKHQRDLSLNIYKKLDDWIQVSSKAENDAIDDVCDVVKQAIEEHTKVQDELRIRFMDFFVDKSILNFIEPAPEKLSAKEHKVDDKFSIPQQESLIEELSMLFEGSDLISNRKVVSLLLRKA